MGQLSFRDINKRCVFNNHGLPLPPSKSDFPVRISRRGHSVAKFRRLSGYYFRVCLVSHRTCAPSLIRVFHVRSIGSKGPNVSSCGQRRLCSNWADAQADLRLCWAHMSFCWYWHAATHMLMQSDYTFVLY